MEGSGNALQRKPSAFQFRMENPFAFKVGQVFTGFGIGCGVGIGLGRPLNLRAIPLLNDVMAATGGATYALSGVGRQANSILRKLGAKNIQVGIGCGVGFGHGFGVGLAVKPGVLNRVRLYLTEAMGKVIAKLGQSTGIAIDESLPKPGKEDNSQLIGEVSETINGSSKTRPSPMSIPSGIRSGKVLDELLQNPLFQGKNNMLSELVSGLQSENDILKLLLKHHLWIEELVDENKKFKEILVNDLKVPANKQGADHSGEQNSLCTDCFKCSRKRRKNRNK